MKQCVYILLLLAVIVGCKKYPEDKTLVHFKKPEKRLKKGTDWKITEYKVNGVDSLPYVNSLNPWGVKIEEVKFEHLGPGSFHVYNHNCNINFKVKSDDRIVSLGFTPGYPISYPLFFIENNDWNIKRLDHKVFTIEIDKNGKNYRATFAIEGE